MLKISSPPRQLGQMEPNLAGNIYVRSNTWHIWSLGVSLSKLCPTAPTSVQDACCFLR
jgi:hypothetical protein